MSRPQIALELHHLLKIARDAVDERGVIQTLRRGPRYVANYLRIRRAWQRVEEADGFDAKYGTDTSLMLGPADFGTDSEQVRHASLYRATRPGTFERIMQAMDVRPADYVFIDVGSGKGRILLLASDRPFKRIIGVELSPRLHEMAAQNVEIFRSKTGRGGNIELVCADATAYDLPADNSVFYFFDPFELPVMSTVVANIGRSLQKHPRKVFIAYVNPTYCAAMDRSGFLERIQTSADGGSPETHSEYPWVIYTNREA